MALVLTPTLEAEIVAKRAEITTKEAEIAAQEVHTTRVTYIAAVQPLQNQRQTLHGQLQALIEQNKIIKAENVALIAAEPPTTEEIDKKWKFDIASEIALKYSLADEISMTRKLITGESQLTDEDIITWLEDVNNAKAKYPKI